MLKTQYPGLGRSGVSLSWRFFEYSVPDIALPPVKVVCINSLNCLILITQCIKNEHFFYPQ